MAMTVSSMAQSNYSLYQFAQNNGMSLFGNNSTNKTSGIANLWNNYSNSQSSSNSYNLNATDVYGIRQGVAELLSSYNGAKNEFKEEFSSTMDGLSKAIKDVKSTNFKVGEDALKKTDVTTTDKDGKTTTSTKTEMSKDLQTAVDNVKSLVSSYNDAVGFFQDNAGMSKRLDRMNELFADTTYRASNYQSIGINVAKDGSMAVDEDKLANAIVSNPDKVSRILGNDGLAGKAQSHVNVANSQREQLFPSVNSLFGDELKTAQVYTGSGLLRMNSYANVGNLFNMYF